MEDWLGPLLNSRLLISATIVIFTTIVYRCSILAIKKNKTTDFETIRRKKVFIKNFLVIATLILILLVWAEQISHLGLSLAAFIVGIIIATKELSLCLLGGVYLYLSKSFSIGDRIQIKEHRGDVVNISLLNFTLLEIGPTENFHQFTGKSISVPLSTLVCIPAISLVNESFHGEYVVHYCSVAIKRREDVEMHKTALLNAAQEVCSSYIESAQKNMNKMSNQAFIETPDVAPRVSYDLSQVNIIVLLLRFPAPCNRKGRLEQQIKQLYLQNIMQV